ncbi:hypothetical protein ABR33_05855 [Enterobacter bugandensis]|uniref:hypothetical protein n=1 Tax=Enterobacter bugandensis TaxID=881260 RepID=UPI000643348D|nr:hypothetical protein [Enterobacter bugandensis]KLQ32519.1 hypothetical protein ABR33_05855 [Enterobacter bugandensis]
MKFRNAWLKYYAAFDDGTQGGGDAGGGAADQATETDTDDSDPGDNGERGEGDPNDNDSDDDQRQRAENGDQDDDEGEEFTFDGQPLNDPNAGEDGENDSKLVKQLRAQLREQSRQLKQSTQAQQKPATTIDNLPPKPQLGDDGIDWDESKLAEAMDKWYEQKAEAEAHQKTQQAKAEQFQTRLQERGEVYKQERATAIKRIAGYEQAEELVAGLPEPLQAALLLNSQKPTLTVMALARNEKLRQEIEDAYNNDHIRLGYLIADIDRRAGTAPKVKKDVNGAPQVRANGGAKNLGQLEAAKEKARASGNWDPYFELKAKLEKKS